MAVCNVNPDMMSKIGAFKAVLYAWLLSAVEQGQADTAKYLAKQDRAQSSGVRLVVTLTVAGLVAAFLLPVAITEIVGVDTSNWSSGAQSIWNILDLLVVLAIMLFFIGLALVRSRL